MEAIDSVITTPPPTPETFSEWIPCERCVARSLWKISGKAGQPLFLCGHHKVKAEVLPKFQSWAVQFVPLSDYVKRS
jgi:hypothetical protein